MNESSRHYEWRKRVAVHFPALSARVFALRQRTYMGCGFHWNLERRLGLVISRVLNYDEGLTISDMIADEIAFEMLLRDLIRAEFSARGWDFPRK